MPDDRIQQDRIQRGLDAYADRLQRTPGLAPAAEIRRRADRRRRNRATAAAFAAVLITGAGLGVVLNRPSATPPIPADPSPSASVSPSATPSAVRSTSTSGVRSNLNQLRQLGVDLETGVLIDVADDGIDAWMQVRADDTVDFTGAAKDGTTEMSLNPAPVTGRNRVVITPVGRPGFCVAATAQLPLALQPCRAGDEAQTWRVVLAGDSGQINLSGPYGDLTVDGRSGLQTIRF